MLSWIFIGATSYIVGMCVQNLLCFLLHTDRAIYAKYMKHPHILRVLCGLCTVNVFAQIFSLFGPVGFGADMLLLLLCLLLLIIDKGRIFKELKTFDFNDHKASFIAYIVLVMIFSYGTSRGYMHFDTNLYHAQAIRWIEEYGVVPGLANIQSRFGYNSAEFALNAIYGFKWMLGRSLHTTSGFFSLISSFVAFGIIRCIKRDEGGKIVVSPSVSDYARLGLIYYLGIIYSDIVSPASDNYAGVLIFDIVILWLDATEIREGENPADRKSDTVYAIMGILSVLSVYAVTIKLSVCVLVLLAFIPGIYWIKNRDIKSIAVCLLSGLAIAIPFFVRGYIISGWILYPSTVIGFGHPDWAMPEGMAVYDAKEIGMWGRGITDAARWSQITAFNWMPGWWNSLGAVEKLLFMGMVISVVCSIACVMIALIKRDGNFFYGQLPVMLTISAGAVLWFFSAPLIRYGYPYLILMPTLFLGYVMKYFIRNDRSGGMVFLFVFLALCALRIRGLVKDVKRTVGWEYYVNQQDYIDAEAHSFSVGDIVFWYSEDSGQIGYYKFPATAEERHDFTLRGDDLSDGFKHVE